MKVCFTRDRYVESAMGRAFEALGHSTCFYHYPTHWNQFSEYLNANSVDTIFFMSSAPKPKPKMMKTLSNNHRILYWERRAPPKSLKPKNYEGIIHNYFSIWNDGVGHYLPCASEDHLSLKTGSHYGVTLISSAKKTVQTYPIDRCHPNRVALHKRIDTDIPGRYTLIGNIPFQDYDDRFIYMANSLCSIGIWNKGIGVPLRFFEIASTGTPIITYPLMPLRKLFTPGVHYIETESLSSSLDYYLNDTEALAEIGRNGYDHFKKNHTYVHRAEEIIDSLHG